MKITHLLLTRHGETCENREHVLQGQLPGRLSDLGIAQARQLAEQLKNEPIDVVVCSDLARSYDTARIVGLSHGLEPRQTSLLREMDWGIYTGKALEDVDWQHLPPGVESVDNLFRRAGEFVDYLRVKYGGKRILTVGHGAFNRAILTYLEGKKPWEMLERPIMENTEVVRLDFQ